MRHQVTISSLERWRPSCSLRRVSGGTLSLKKARTSSRNAISSLLKARSMGSSCDLVCNTYRRWRSAPSPWGRVGVRGYGLSIVRNPSPGSLRDPTSPNGRGETRLVASSDPKFMDQTLLVPRLQIALAVIAALRAPRRAVAAGFGLVAGARLLAAGALHQHASALAVGDQAALAGWLERLLAAWRIGLLFLRIDPGRALHRTREIRARQRGDLFAELLAQHPGLDLLDLTFGEFAQLKRSVRHPDQPVHLETEMRHDVAHLAIFAFADRKHQPDIGALVALQGRVDRTIFDAIDLDAFFQLIKLGLRHLAMGADAIAPQPAGVGQFERAR